MTKRHGSELHPQALRLEERTRVRLSALADELCTAGCEVTPAEATRGLCLLALDLALGRAGASLADVVRLAASDPTPQGVHHALDALLWLLDLEPCTTPKLSEAHAAERSSASKPARPDLHNQAIRLPQHSRDELKSLATELRAAGTNVKARKALRGLCLLALEIAFCAATKDLANAFRLAARNPTAEGVQRALEAVQSLLEGVPSTVPDPPILEDDAPTSPSPTSCPPSTIPTSRAA